ncbi:MAG: protein kinase, partial [Bacteroidota bacterium]
MDRQQRLERLHRISSLFDKALERDPGEWSAFLLSECPDDPEIRQKVQDLLVSFQGPDDPRGTAGSDLLPDVDGLSEDKPIHMVGRRIGPYWIKRLIADGNASVVFEALNTETNAPVALRVLRSAVASNRAAMRRLTSDTSVLNRLDDSRFVHTRDIRTEEGATVVVSDLAEGLPLSDFLRANGALSEDAARPIFRQLVETLQAAHKRGIVHRDLQASDVFLKPAGPDQWTIQVTGFGLARMPSHAQLGNQTLGSGQRVAYLSPEHLTAHSSVDRRSDLYAAGMILCEMLGQPLVSSSDSADVVRKQVLAGFDEGDLPETQDDLRLILARLLALDPAQRFQSAGDVLAALGRAQDTEPIRPAAPTPPRPRAPKPTSAAPPRPGASARPS